MRKLIALILALCLPVSALAATPTVTANGVVESDKTVQITAPCSGVLLPFDWRTGDLADADDVLFEMDTIKLYAPVDGTVGAVFAEPGDLASDVIGQYSMLMSLEKENDLTISASTTGAYNDEDNRTIHMGETVYFEQSNDRDNEGEGRVIAVDGKNYVVELTKGDFDDGDSVKIYREDNMTTKSCIGSGKIVRSAEVYLSSVGRVVSCPVREGYKVRKGDVLMELVSQDADNTMTSAEIRAGRAGALEVQAMSGQQVYKGMLLARVHDLSAMNVVASVDEMDLDLIDIGDNLTVVLDRYPDVQLSGTVREISHIGVPKQNATYYDVTLSVSTGMELLPGMNATVWLAKEN